MKLRYLTTKHEVTSEKVREYADKHCIPCSEAKTILVNERGPILEYYDEDCATWFEVKHITEYRE